MAENSLIEDVEYTGGKEEESPILIAQRYLNIFHQIHIFNTAKREEFDNSLLEMPEKVKEVMMTIPGGRVLLEHVQEVSQQKGLKFTNAATSDAVSQTQENTPIQVPQPGAAISGSVSLGTDFAQSLADSLATAFKNNHLMPGSNINELSALLSKSFSAYASNMQTVLSQNMQQFSKVQTQLQSQFQNQMQMQTKMQMQMQEQLKSQIHNISSSTSVPSPISGNSQPAAAANQANMQTNNANTTTINNINMDSSCFSDFPVSAITASITEALKQNNQQQIEAIKAFGEILSKTIKDSQQALAQTLTHSATHPETIYITVPNQSLGNVTFSNNQKNEKNNFFKNVSDKISETTNKLTPNKSSEKNKNEDSLLNKINKGISEKLDGIKEELANKTAEVKKNKEIKNAKKNEQKHQQPEKQQNPQASKNEEIKKQPAAKPVQTPKASSLMDVELEKMAEQDSLDNIFFSTDKTTPEISDSITDISLEKAISSVDEKKQSAPAPKQKADPVADAFAETPAPKQKADPVADAFTETPAPKQKADPVADAFVETPTPKQKADPVAAAFTETPTPKQKADPLADAFAETPTPKQKADPLADAFAETPAPKQKADPVAAAFTETPTPKQTVKKSEKDDVSQQSRNKPTPSTTSASEQPKKASQAAQVKPTPQTQKPKKHSPLYDEAMQKIKAALHSNDTVSLNEINVKPVSLTGEEMPQQTATEDIILDEESLERFFSGQSPETEEEWEYVDENGTPVSPNEEEEWEYVDENGTPVSPNEEEEWEYVDENGNPVSPNEGDEWEYVDENGNPVSPDEWDEWEYVDENGNPVSPDEGDEWEYVDENGNPVSPNEWEYKNNTSELSQSNDNWDIIEKELANNTNKK